jgi:hypothetical protein
VRAELWPVGILGRSRWDRLCNRGRAVVSYPCDGIISGLIAAASRPFGGYDPSDLVPAGGWSVGRRPTRWLWSGRRRTSGRAAVAARSYDRGACDIVGVGFEAILISDCHLPTRAPDRPTCRPTWQRRERRRLIFHALDGRLAGEGYRVIARACSELRAFRPALPARLTICETAPLVWRAPAGHSCKAAISAMSAAAAPITFACMGWRKQNPDLRHPS